MLENILNKLPGYNCGKCGYSNCDEFANALLNKDKDTSDCAVLLREEYEEKRTCINQIIEKAQGEDSGIERIVGLIDAYEADITLGPLSGEHSCREVLLPTSTSTVKIHDMVRYRPLGCPIIHFAEIIEINNFLLTVHIIGPCNRSDNDFKYIDLGVCMIIAFEGKYQGKRIKVGETVRFLPKHCMMQKIHSGVVVNIEKENVTIEGIDLKVWEPPQKIL